MKTKIAKLILIIIPILFVLFILTTYFSIKSNINSLHQITSNAENIPIIDRNGKPLSISYQNRWNSYDNLPLHQISLFLQNAFIISEDKNFYQHQGTDWLARISALKQNFQRRKIIRGASTITEQVVRILNPRSRNLWSKWLETFEAANLENNLSKADILEFYLNQLPYSSGRRGVLQASRYYFNRDLSSLSKKEMLALVVLAQAPSSFDLYRNSSAILPKINQLAQNLLNKKIINREEFTQIDQEKFKLEKPESPTNAFHFINFVRSSSDDQKLLRTTLDANLQKQVQSLLDQSLESLNKRAVHNGAVLIIDHQTNQILAWNVGGADKINSFNSVPSSQINAVTTARQPGSTLKPFLYATALEYGWTAVTLIDDSPLNEAIGDGLHKFHNYSHNFYGNITLREALGNSLNIPALKTIHFVGEKNYLDRLHDLGFRNLNRDYTIYNGGLALGSGEVSLFELVQAYSALANNGKFRNLEFLLDNFKKREEKQIFSPEITSLIANIISDPWARRLEFGSSSILNMSSQTAVKTGTSTDYLDAWAIGFNHRFVVGIWMGNLEHTPTDGLTGASGPALLLRNIFSELNQNEPTKPLYLSPKLVKKDICINYNNGSPCVPRSEYFITSSSAKNPNISLPISEEIKIIRPTNNLKIAFDPRIPGDKQAFQMAISGVSDNSQIDWIINEEKIATTLTPKLLWPITPGNFIVEAVITQNNKIIKTEKVKFVVK